MEVVIDHVLSCPKANLSVLNVTDQGVIYTADVIHSRVGIGYHWSETFCTGVQSSSTKTAAEVKEALKKLLTDYDLDWKEIAQHLQTNKCCPLGLRFPDDHGQEITLNRFIMPRTVFADAMPKQKVIQLNDEMYKVHCEKHKEASSLALHLIDTIEKNNTARKIDRTRWQTPGEPKRIAYVCAFTID